MHIPTLSVTITSYNYAQYIGKAIESVLMQTFRDFELIIIDDVSSDNSVEVIKRYAAKDERIRFVEHTENKGGTPTLIEACEMVRGRYMVNIDSDDWIVNPQAFELQVAMLEKDPEIAFVFSPEAQHDDNGKCTRLMRAADTDTIWKGEVAIEKVMNFFVAHTGTMVRMSAYQACGGYNVSYRYTLDLKLWIDLCGQGKVGYIGQLLYAYRQHEGSMSRFSKFQLWQEELLRAIESGFSGPLAKHISDLAAMRRRVLSHMLVAGPLHDIFSGRYRRGWMLYLVSLKMMPRETLLQKVTLILIARTILRAKGYAALEKGYATISRSKRRKMQEDAQLQAQILGKTQTAIKN